MKKVNRELRKTFHRTPCTVCGMLPCDPDHIISFANRQEDEPFNMWSLCRRHHTEKRTIGLTKFSDKYQLKPELKRRGFHFCEFMEKWMVLTDGGWDDCEN